MNGKAVFIQNLFKTYGDKKAVDNLSFEVPKGCCFGILGPNGAGKTTTMKMIYGKALRDKHTETRVQIFGLDPEKHELETKYLTGLVPQEDNLDAELSVFNNLLIYSKFYGIPKKEAEIKINQLIDFMDLQEKMDCRIRDLSGGMKRRLVIARALLNSPKLLILDEPTTGLDPQVRHLIWNKIRQLKKEGVTVLITTHYMDEAFQVCDKIMIMDNGKKIIEGRPHELLASHIEKYVLEIRNKEESSNLSVLKANRNFRVDETQETVFVYSDSLDQLKSAAAEMDLANCYLRQSNLEDLFLKSTGRELNDAQ